VIASCSPIPIRHSYIVNHTRHPRHATPRRGATRRVTQACRRRRLLTKRLVEQAALLLHARRCDRCSSPPWPPLRTGRIQVKLLVTSDKWHIRRSRSIVCGVRRWSSRFVLRRVAGKSRAVHQYTHRATLRRMSSAWLQRRASGTPRRQPCRPTVAAADGGMQMNRCHLKSSVCMHG